MRNDFSFFIRFVFFHFLYIIGHLIIQLNSHVNHTFFIKICAIKTAEVCKILQSHIQSVQKWWLDKSTEDHIGRTGITFLTHKPGSHFIKTRAVQIRHRGSCKLQC